MNIEEDFNKRSLKQRKNGRIQIARNLIKESDKGNSQDGGVKIVRRMARQQVQKATKKDQIRIQGLQKGLQEKNGINRLAEVFDYTERFCTALQRMIKHKN